MNNKIYVGNLPYQLSEEELKDLFAQIGNVTSVRVVTDAMSGRSKGFGFVEMENEEQAKKAIDQLDGTEIQGRSIRVAPARPSRDRGERRPRNYNRGGQKW
jgi:RNA recognition motif-containing protein